jgi:hypothetical protein
VIDNDNKNLLQTANILVASSLFLSHKTKTLSNGGGVYLLKAQSPSSRFKCLDQSIYICFLSFFEAF